VLDVVKQIRGDHAATGPSGVGIAAINRRADAVIGLVQAIKGDTGNILGSVKNIEASAASINTKLP
jgi:hypothetical protein